MPDDFTSVVRTLSLSTMPAEKYGAFDSDVLVLQRLHDVNADDVVRRLGVETEAVRLALEIDGRPWSQSCAAVLRERPELLTDFRRIYAATLRADESTLNITDVRADGAVLSDTALTLLVSYTNAADSAVDLVSVDVRWAGEPFVVQQEVGRQEAEGTLEVNFDEERTLPVGPAEFLVTLFRADGAQATFRRTVYVLPANPLSLGLGPAGARVTGSWSVRGDYLPASDTFLTECEITIANGDAGAVSMNRRVSWEFWDGGVGTGTLVESGAFDWAGAISVPTHGVWRGSIWFSSPRGSGIFGRYDRKEDMALQVTMSATDGRVISGGITARVLLAYGVNIIKVGDFGSQEHVDLYDAVDRMRQIYEARDITLRGVDRWIISSASAGSYTTINDENEFRDLLQDWSVPNDFVDVYVVQSFAWDSYNGYAGNIPGPASKGGREDGVAVDKSGFTDASGTARLPVTTLAQLIGHEVGHYLGLAHLEDTNNLMRSNTGDRGPDLNYDQYRLMFPHGYMVYE
jgi:predicted Zn-dependent protease with MMP-like domain